MKNKTNDVKNVMKKREVVNGGFTLVELLATIAILALVSVLVIYTAINVIDNAKENSYKVTIGNIEKMSENYLLENKDNVFWLNGGNGNYLYQCISVQNLIDYGYFKNDVLNSKVSDDRQVNANDYIYVEMNSATKTIVRNVLLIDDDYSSGLCGDNGGTGNIDFSVVPTGWAREKEVTITYRLLSGIDGITNYKYSYIFDVDSNVSNSDNFNKNTVIQRFRVNKNGIINASIDNGNNNIKNASLIVSKIDNNGPVVSSNITGKKVKKNVTIPLKVVDDESGLGTDELVLSELSVSIGNNVLNSGVTLEKVDVNNYNLRIDNYNYAGEVKMVVNRDSVFDNLGNGNESREILTGVIFDNTYKINYDANNGTGTMEDTVCTYGQTCTLRTNGFTRTGYTFLGWSTNKNDTASKYSNGYTYSVFNETNDITMYAIWKDTTPPTCSLSVTKGGINFSTTNDNIGVVSSWLSTSSTAISGTTSLTLSAGTKYGFVKDAAGNVGKCSVKITDASKLYTCSKSATKNTSTVSCTASNYSNPSGACGNKNYSSNNCSVSYTYTKTYTPCTRSVSSYSGTCKCRLSGNFNWNYFSCTASTCSATCSAKGFDTPEGSCTTNYRYYFGSSSSVPGYSSCSASSFTCNSNTYGQNKISCSLTYTTYKGNINCYSYSCSSGTYSGGNCYKYNQSSCGSGWSSSTSGYTCSNANYPNNVGAYCY